LCFVGLPDTGDDNAADVADSLRNRPNNRQQLVEWILVRLTQRLHLRLVGT